VSARGPVTLAAVGDIMLGRTIGARLEKDATLSPFADILPALRDADLTIGNLECSMGTGGAPAKKAFTFRAPPSAATTLRDAGFDLVALANNHVLDYGADVLAQTTSLLDAAGIAHAGAGANEAAAHRPAIVEARGTRFAFLAYVRVMQEGPGGFDTKSWEAKGDASGIAWADPARVARDVAAAKPLADHVVVMLHSGFEASYIPNVWQKLAAHAAIDAGATLVIGAHPHVLQGYERYKGGFIAYSLGNFVFDKTMGYSAILHLTLDAGEVRDVAWTPVMIKDGSPRPVDDKTAKWIRNVIETLSLQAKYTWREK
jgi:poly-gamma-glutamate synthesis protein (capsule biosynthesis protein)